MAKEIMWTKTIIEEFVAEAMLSDEEEMILRTRAKGWTRTEQSMKLNISLTKLDRIIKNLKRKYDNVQKTNPLLPPRKPSKEEDYMDNNWQQFVNKIKGIYRKIGNKQVVLLPIFVL